MVFWPQAFFKSMKFESPADAGLSNRSNGAEAPAAAFGKTASADFASAGYKFESPADAGPSNRSIGAEAPLLPHSAKPHPRILPQRGINMDVGQKRSGHAITFDLTSLQYWKTRNAVFLRREGLTDSWNGQTQ